MKNYKTIIAIFVFAATLLSAASCTNDYFNQERYEEIIESTFPVSNVDKYHDWNLMQSMYVSADLTASVTRIASMFLTKTQRLVALQRWHQERYRARVCLSLPCPSTRCRHSSMP